VHRAASQSAQHAAGALPTVTPPGPACGANRISGRCIAEKAEKYEIGDCFFREYPQNGMVFV
jgi:hypothetical protein